MPARDASGVPLPLRELLGVLAELGEHLPMPADDNWERYRVVRETRLWALTGLLSGLCRDLEVGDRHPAAAETDLVTVCRLWTETARAQLAEPLGYEPERGQDDTKGEPGA